MQFFNTRFLEEAVHFIAGLDPKTAKKVLYKIDLAEQTNDPKLFLKNFNMTYGNSGLNMQDGS